MKTKYKKTFKSYNPKRYSVRHIIVDLDEKCMSCGEEFGKHSGRVCPNGKTIFTTSQSNDPYEEQCSICDELRGYHVYPEKCPID